MMPVELFIDACLAGDPAEHVRQMTNGELRTLLHYCEARMAENTKQGGVPALMKWLCAHEAAQRFKQRKD